MAAVSQWPASDAVGVVQGNNGKGHEHEHKTRKFDVDVGSNYSNKDSDTYSLEARSERSVEKGRSIPHSPAGSDVRPDSLALTSPLEQLTRSLSFSKKDGQQSTIHAVASAMHRHRLQDDKGTAHQLNEEQIILQYLNAEPVSVASTSNLAQSHPRRDNQRAGNSSDFQRYQMSNQQAEPSGKTHLEPVRFSDDTTRTTGTEDTSDNQSQLINAFRSSYHTHMTRSGGIRDSSYSWTGQDAESPTVTMDFKQADGGVGNLDQRGASRTEEGRFKDSPEGENEDRGQRHPLTGIEIDNRDWQEVQGQNRARASSWDSQAAKQMNLHRIPSQKSAKNPADGRASGMSAFDPFSYASYESALRASQGTTVQKDQQRASNWTSLTGLTEDTVRQGEHAGQTRPLSTLDDGGESPSLYAYAVDTPSVAQDHFSSQPTLSAAAPIPIQTRQSSRMNFSRPHDTLRSHNNASLPHSQSDQQTEHPDTERLQPALYQEGSYHPGRMDYDSVYSAYAHPDEGFEHDPMPAAPFHGVGTGVPGYSRSSSSDTTYTIQEANSSTRPDLHSLGSYQTASKDGNSQLLAPEGNKLNKWHKRTQSQVLASAITKHREKRAAAGLTTEGQYYVDPKSNKYYFVAASGQAGGTALVKAQGKDSEKSGKERRKLYKKESGWEATKISLAKRFSSASPPSAPQMVTRGRAGSLSESMGSSSRASEEGNNSGNGGRWKLWSSARSHGSREHTPQSSPQQISKPRGIIKHPDHGVVQDGQEYISDKHVPAGFAMISSPTNYSQSSQLSSSHHSPRHLELPASYTSSRPAPSPYDGIEVHSSPASQSSRQLASRISPSTGSSVPYLDLPPGSMGDAEARRHDPRNRSGSVYSNYSFYEMPSDQGYISSSRNSPVNEQTARMPRRSESPSTIPVPLASPYMPPNAPEFQPSSVSHSRQPSTTLDKAKSSMARSGSLQLLAPSKQQNLTVPKGDAAHQQDLMELARSNPNDPLVCLHFGIDAHERGDLEESARLFEKSASGGCGLGMLMYGLTLRHGWGCESDPERGFRYLQQAAESVVQNLDRVISGQIQLSEQQLEEQSAKSELVLSIYELGQCFLRGWGVAKDKKTALQYFTLAANLGDPDAQSELGFCYSTGRGCKKDLKQAAKYYRMAAKQGQITYGMQWIFKPKYD